MLKKIWKKLSSESGNAAMIFALSVVPIFAIGGFAIDLQNTVKKKHKVQLVLDSAVLAAARVKQTGASDSDVKASVRKFMDAQLQSAGAGLVCRQPHTVIGPDNESISATISCEQETSLTRTVGRQKMDFQVRATSTYGIDKIDVAFMFDVSGSMNSSRRLTNLKSAAKEAIDILLPADATPKLIENTRLAMVSYNTMVNAGQYFEKVTGVPATRTYSHVIQPDRNGPSTDPGQLVREFDVRFMDTSRNQEVSKLGYNAVMAIEDWSGNDRTRNDYTVAVEVPRSSPFYGRVGSMRLELRGPTRRTRNDNTGPYSLWGESGSRYSGRNWREGAYTLRIRAYRQRNRKGGTLFDRTVRFEVERGGRSEPELKQYTLTSTCVWERGGSTRFTDAAPGPNRYLEHQKAWFVEDRKRSDGGYWQVGHPNRSGSWYYGNECRNSRPIGLTNNRNTLNNHVNSLNAGGGTAGHLGVAWSWYLVSEYWGGVFTGASAPMKYSEPDSSKVVILMTDGEFNAEILPQQGNSDTQARALCDQMKQSSVKVYSVALQAPRAGREVLRYCASGPEFYFEPNSAAELTEAYRKIATSISDLRLSQ